MYTTRKISTKTHKGLLSAMLSSEARKRVRGLSDSFEYYIEFNRNVLDKGNEGKDGLSRLEEIFVSDLLSSREAFEHATYDETLSPRSREFLTHALKWSAALPDAVKRAAKTIEEPSSDLLSGLIVTVCVQQETVIDVLHNTDAPYPCNLEIVQGRVGFSDILGRPTLMLLANADYRRFWVHQTIDKIYKSMKEGVVGKVAIRMRHNFLLGLNLPGVFEAAYAIVRACCECAESDEEKIVVGPLDLFEHFIDFYDVFASFIPEFKKCGSRLLASGEKHELPKKVGKRTDSIITEVMNSMRGRGSDALPYAYLQALNDYEYARVFKAVEEPMGIRISEENEATPRELKRMTEISEEDKIEVLEKLVYGRSYGLRIIEHTVAFMIAHDLRDFFEKEPLNRASLDKLLHQSSNGIRYLIEFESKPHPEVFSQFISVDHIQVGNTHKLPKVEMLAFCSKGGKQAGDILPSPITARPELSGVSTGVCCC